jgi:glycosyltransferase involved in cell wall biosynthesis
LNSTNLLVINYAMDEKHQVFSHQIDLVNKLASHFDSVTVLTGHVGVCHVSDNVQVINFKWIAGKRVSSLLGFLKIFLKIVIKNRYSVLFSHMTSTHSAFISPITKLLRLKHYLWYAHASNGVYLRISKLLTNGIITSTPGSCPLEGEKIYPIGQSIDKNKFEKQQQAHYPIKNLIHTGRLDPSKNVDLIIESVESLRKRYPELTLEIVGSPSSDLYEEYSQNLISKFSSHPYSSWLKFTSYIPREDLPKLLRGKDGFIHSFQGSLDKTLVEATFSGLTVITINREYLNIFGSWGSGDNYEDLTLESEALVLFKMSEDEIKREVDRRYALAVAQHEVTGWIDRLVKILKS